MIGRAMSDIQQMQGSFEPPETDGETSVLTGTAAVSKMRDYQKQVVSYTSGRGRLFCSLKGYAPCKNQEAVVQAVGYDSERDLENPTGSVFCAHGGLCGAVGSGGRIYASGQRHRCEKDFGKWGNLV